jgi:tetratricopeptide (TPR) repeat protein
VAEAPPPPPSPSPRRPEPIGQDRLESRISGPGNRGQNVIANDPDNDDGMAERRRKPALNGPLAEIEQALAAGRADAALARATAWHKQAPGDVLALIGLGDALEAKRDLETAARVYGSIIDLFPARADFRRFAGERLERLGKAQRALIIDTYRRSVEQRPDHLTGHRMLAYALVRDGRYAEAFAAILAGIDRQYPSNRFAGAERVLSEDVGMIGAAYIAHGGKRDEVMAQLAKRRIALPTQPSTRFIMYWETDANDVDFHIRDGRGGHAWYSHKQLPSGGELYADITTGYGPECFAINGTPTAGPYRLSINYYSQGPMGYGMGLLQIQKFDGQGNLSFEDRPYVIMTDQAFVDLGTWR